MSKNNEIATFYLEKVVNTHIQDGMAIGEKVYKVLGWSGVKKFKELPAEYTDIFDQETSFWESESLPEHIFVHSAGKMSIAIFKGYLYSKSDWETNIEPVLHEAGVRLGKIMREQREKKESQAIDDAIYSEIDRSATLKNFRQKGIKYFSNSEYMKNIRWDDETRIKFLDVKKFTW